METYANASGASGVTGYEETPDGIVVQFKSGARFLYTEASAGRGNVERMKALARAGSGLHAFINRVVRRRYASRL